MSCCWIHRRFMCMVVLNICIYSVLSQYSAFVKVFIEVMERRSVVVSIIVSILFNHFADPRRCVYSVTLSDRCRVVYRFDTGRFFGIGIGIPYTGTGWLVFRSVFLGELALLSLYSIVSCMFVVSYHTYIFLGEKGVPTNF